MGRKKQKKNTKRRPPLSLIDKCIYYLAIGVSYIGTLFLVFRLEDLQRSIAFIDTTVIAEDAHMSFLFVAPLCLFLEISGLVFFAVQLSNKTPIFGNSKVKYGQPQWDSSCYPIFDKRRKSVRIKASDRRFRKSILIVWLVCFIIVSAIAPIGLFGRDCLHDDYSITVYNALNLTSDSGYSQEDYQYLTLRTRYISGYRIASRWIYEMEIEMSDGKKFTFDNGDFKSCEKCLDAMTNIKRSFVSEDVTVIGEENVDDVAVFLGLSESQTKELQKLFTNYK